MNQARGFSTKLTLGLVLVLLTLTLAGLATLHLSIGASARQMAEARTYFDDLLVAQRLRAAVEQTVATSRGYLLTGKPDFLDRMRPSEQTARHLLTLLDARADGPQSRELINAMMREVRAYHDTTRAAIEERKRGGSAAAVAYLFERDLMPSRRRLDNLLDGFVQLQQQQFHLNSDRLERERGRTLLAVVGTLSLGFLLSAALAIALARHLTSLYRREQKAIAAAKRAATAREELLATVAHDLRSPLGAIGLKAAMLRRGAADDRVTKQAEGIDRIVRRMDHLVQGLLDAATLEAGQFTLRTSSISVSGIIRDVLDLFADTAASRSIRLEHRTDPSDLLMIADRDRTLQVLSNIVVNAIKFTPPLGRIEVAARRDGAGSVKISVSDTGPGISSHELPHVFERFWKAGADGRTGTGLGLHIAKEIVTAQRGQIWAESQAGVGTTFHFTLPAVSALPASATDAPAPPQALPATASV